MLFSYYINRTTMKPYHGVFLGICLTFAIKVLSKEFRFGNWIKMDTIINLDIHIFEIKILQDIQNCLVSCKTRKLCKYFNYDHQAKVCYLIGGNGTIFPERKPGFSFGNRTEWNMTEYEACGNCSDYGVCMKDSEGKYTKCLNSGCGPPEERNNAIVLGNMFSIRDKIQYECHENYKLNKDISLTSTCLENGTWSPVDFECIHEDVYEFSEIFYFIVSPELNWNAARDKCTMVGGYLTDIKSAEEQNFIDGVIKQSKYTNFRCYWTGGTRENGEFKWLDDTPFTYTYWYPGQPVDYEHCVGIDQSLDYKWNDKPCDWDCSQICKLS